jgi:hypothetical protein
VCIDVLYGEVLSRRRFVCAPKISCPVIAGKEYCLFLSFSVLVDFSHNAMRRLAERLFDGMEDTLEEIYLRHGTFHLDLSRPQMLLFFWILIRGVRVSHLKG